MQVIIHYAFVPTDYGFTVSVLMTKQKHGLV